MWMLALLLSVLPAADAPPEEATCLRAATPVRIDGAPNDAAWAEAAMVRDFRLLDSFDAPDSETVLRLCYDDRYLYALFECTDEDVFTLHSDRDAPLWEADVVQLCLEPTPLLEREAPIYYVFQVAPDNTIFDARLVNSGSGGFRRWAGWACGMRTAARVEGAANDWEQRDGGYTVEMAIPLSAFSETIGGEPLTGQTWRFLGARVDYSVGFERAQHSATGKVRHSLHERAGYSTLHFK